MSEIKIVEEKVQNMVVSPVKIKFPPPNPTHSSVRYLQAEIITLRSELKKQKQLIDHYQGESKTFEGQKKMTKADITNGGLTLRRGIAAAKAHAKRKAEFASRAVIAAKKAAFEAAAIAEQEGKTVLFSLC